MQGCRVPVSVIIVRDLGHSKWCLLLVSKSYSPSLHYIWILHQRSAWCPVRRMVKVVAPVFATWFLLAMHVQSCIPISNSRFAASQSGWLVGILKQNISSHAGQPEIRNFATKTQPHGRVRSGDARGSEPMNC